MVKTRAVGLVRTFKDRVGRFSVEPEALVFRLGLTERSTIGSVGTGAAAATAGVWPGGVGRPRGALGLTTRISSGGASLGGTEGGGALGGPRGGGTPDIGGMDSCGGVVGMGGVATCAGAGDVGAGALPLTKGFELCLNGKGLVSTGLICLGDTSVNVRIFGHSFR